MVGTTTAAGHVRRGRRPTVRAAVDGRRLGRRIAMVVAAHWFAFAALVASGLNGSSMAQLYQRMTGGADPSVLFGTARAVRSDEWLVATPLTVSQVAQGLPERSGVFPGGMDVSVVWDVPYRDWSTLLRPQNWGFFFLPLDQAFAWKWWFAFVALVCVAFVLLAVMWRRVFAALLVAWAFALSPFFQWWFGSGTFWPPAAALAACLAVVVLLRSERRGLRWATAAGTGAVVAAAAVGLYTPFLVASFYPAAAFAIGAVVDGGGGWAGVRRRVARLAPLGVAAVGVVAVMGGYLLTRASTIAAVSSTVYPGHRSVPTGDLADFPALAAVGGVFASGLRSPDLTGYAPNSSEGSSFVLLGAYLLVPVAWSVIDRHRRGKGWDAPMLALLMVGALLAAFVAVPGWDGLARVLLLDQVRVTRILIGFGVLSFLLTAQLGARLAESGAERRAWVPALAGATVVASTAVVAHLVAVRAPGVYGATLAWPVVAVVLTVGVWALADGRLELGGVAVAVVAVALGAWVNPLYRGVLDLRRTAVGQAVSEVEAAHPGVWVAADGQAQTAILRELGVTALSGVQSYPSQSMWAAIDPSSGDESSWNRYAHVDWTAVDRAAPSVALAQEDVVRIRLDPCSPTVQQHVAHVLISGDVDMACLALDRRVPVGQGVYDIYDVVPPTGG